MSRRTPDSRDHRSPRGFPSIGAPGRASAPPPRVEANRPSDRANAPSPTDGARTTDADARAVATVDFSQVTLRDVALIVADPSRRHTFPVILHRVLSVPEYRKAVEWAADGRSFVVLDREAFCSKVSNKHFRTEEFRVFVAWLRAFGFRRAKGADDEFHHERFYKPKPWLAHTMEPVADDVACRDL